MGFLLVYLQRLTELPRETAGNVTACAEIVKRGVTHCIKNSVRSILSGFDVLTLFWHHQSSFATVVKLGRKDGENC